MKRDAKYRWPPIYGVLFIQKCTKDVVVNTRRIKNIFTSEKHYREVHWFTKIYDRKTRKFTALKVKLFTVFMAVGP